MLDLDWERYMPILNMNIEELKNIFIEYDQTIDVLDFNLIRLGCKNSNYVVCTNKGEFLLRITDSSGFNNEIPAYELVKGKMNIPDLLFHTIKNNMSIFIYQYISGVSLQKIIVENRQCNNSVVEQVAKAAAIIHSTPKEKIIGFAEYDVPPFEIWYECFLNSETTKMLMGEEMCKRVKQLVLDKHRYISEIDSYKSFIHCDFRAVNMLVDKHGQVFFVDWESASTGHSLGDVGQFFRYRSFFSETHIRLFEQVYNTFANRKLPDNWFALSLFRDLVNPLQLLSSSNKDTPLRNADLVNIIEETLAYWNY